MAGALDQVLQEQVVGALLGLADRTCVRYSSRRLSSPISSFKPEPAGARSFAVAMNDPRKLNSGRNLAPMNEAPQLSYSNGPSTTPSLVVVLPNLRSR